MSFFRFLSARARCGLLVLLWLSVSPVAPVVAQHGCDPGNLIPNCNFDTFYDSPPRQLPQDWWPFVLAGDLTYQQHTDTYWGAPSLAMWSDGGTFVAGIYTQVGGVQPGVAYRASMGWGAPTEPDAFGRRLGIDPTGGVDPNAPTVVWGPMHRGAGALMNKQSPGANLDVSAVAQAPTVTVFVYVDHNYSTGINQIFIDAVSLFVDPVQPAPTPVLPTATPVPLHPMATATATAIATALAAPTATPQPTATPTATATPTTTATPTATHTPTVTPTPTQTLTPTATATSTLPPRPTATPAVRQAPDAAGAAPPRSLLWGGLGALGTAGLLAVVLALTRHR